MIHATQLIIPFFFCASLALSAPKKFTGPPMADAILHHKPTTVKPSAPFGSTGWRKWRKV